jgi:hypothetical protein
MISAAAFFERKFFGVINEMPAAEIVTVRLCGFRRTRFFLQAAVGACVLCASSIPLQAQPRYDGGIEDRFALNPGGYEQFDNRTRIRMGSIDLGLGVILDLERNLNVEERTGAVFRLDGYYRFHRNHRIEWDFYSVEREGEAEVFGENIRIGDLEFRFGSDVSTESEFGLFKLGYAWSFVHNRTYEFHVGAGLNFYRQRLRFFHRLTRPDGIDVSEYSVEGDAPLPTYSFGLRYRLPHRWVARLGYEVAALELGEYRGRFQETFLGLEHNTGEHIGFGLALTGAGNVIEAEDDRLIAEFDSRYRGGRLYLRTYF